MKRQHATDLEVEAFNDLDQNRLINCVSVGFLLRDDEILKILAPNMADVESEFNVQAFGIITIPASCVTKVSMLVEVDKLLLFPWW